MKPDQVRIDLPNSSVAMPQAQGIQVQPCEIPVPGSLIPHSGAMIIMLAGDRERQRGFPGLVGPLGRAELRRLGLQLLNLAEMGEQRDAENAQRVQLAGADGAPVKAGEG